VVVVFTIAALVLGGGGTSVPLSELLLQMVAALAIGAWFLVPSGVTSLPLQPVKPVCVLAGVVLALPVLQLVPLPPGLWQSLPGRATEQAVLALAGRDTAWMPISIQPDRTLASLLSVIPPLAALAMVAALDRRERLWVVAAVGAMALISVALGGMQMAAGKSGMWRPYGDYNLGFINGFQANRNATADVLLIGLVAVVAVAMPLRRRIGEVMTQWLVAILAALLALACALTASRTGVLLVPVVAAYAIAIWRPALLRPGAVLVAAGSMFVLMAGAIFLARGNAVIGRIVQRFTLEGEFRFELWKDTLPAIGQFWPVGSGMGTYRAAFLPHERLEVVDQTWPVRAHNDYLELALEAGLPGLVLLLIAATVVVKMAVTAWKNATLADRPQLLFAIAALSVIALHSIVDYPLRSMALAHMSAIAGGILAALAARTAGISSAEVEDA
jgi:O-antigen ligase